MVVSNFGRIFFAMVLFNLLVVRSVTAQLLVRSAVAGRVNVSSPTPGFLYHGVYPGGLSGNEDDLTLADLKSYEQTVGKSAAWVYFSNNWFRDRSFPLATVTWIKQQGSIPFIRMMLRSRPERGGADPVFNVDRILSGDFDSDLRSWARGAKDFGDLLLVEYGTEVNGDWFPWNGSWSGKDHKKYGDPNYPDGPEMFRDAYQRIIGIFREEGVSNIAWVFHLNYEDSPDDPWNRFELYYPGDDWIDCLAVSVYGALTPRAKEREEFRASLDLIYPRIAALSSNKPVIVAEFGSARGHPSLESSVWAEDALKEMLTLRWPRIIGFAWWNERWENDDNPQHNTTMRVQDSKPLRAVFRSIVGSNEKVLGRG